MKHANLFLLFVLFAACLQAQDSTFVLSKYEEYSTSRGKALKTMGRTIGQIRNTYIDVLRTTDIKKGDTVSVVRLTSAASNIDPWIFIDKEEVPNVINLLKYYAAEMKNGSVMNGVDYRYITPNDVSITCSDSPGFFGGTFITFSKIYRYSRTQIAGGLSFGKKDIEGLIQLMQTASNAL